MSWRRSVRAAPRASSGNILVELALVAPVLALMLTGLIDFGAAAYNKMALESAARAGVEYAMANPSDTAGIAAAVAEAADVAAEEITVTTAQFCECPDGTAAACSDTCGAATSPNVFLSVDVSRSYGLILSYPGFESPLTLTGEAVFRVQ
jgi:Flp pilus assembly protein TadG